MIKEKKMYNIKIYNDELCTIIAILMEEIRRLRILEEKEQDDIKKDFIKSNKNEIRRIIARLDTGGMYNDDNYGVYKLDTEKDFCCKNRSKIEIFWLVSLSILTF